MAAILLHDVGHGPLSHALETAIFQDVPHEQLSLFLMQRLNEEFERQAGLGHCNVSRAPTAGRFSTSWSAASSTWTASTT